MTIKDHDFSNGLKKHNLEIGITQWDPFFGGIKLDVSRMAILKCELDFGLQKNISERQTGVRYLYLVYAVDSSNTYYC